MKFILLVEGTDSLGNGRGALVPTPCGLAPSLEVIQAWTFAPRTAMHSNGNRSIQFIVERLHAR